MPEVRLTSYSHGAGCGCKISPAILEDILKQTNQDDIIDPKLLIGNETKDDAAVYSLVDKNVLISTTDFFMPIVDDPFDFGWIASVNAISDVYAMGGRPILALSILGWPVDKLSADIARFVISGSREACKNAGIKLAGGHSIDTPEPIFGLAVNGIAPIKNVKSNTTAIPGCELYLTKPLGIGIFTTAHTQGVIRDEDLARAVNLMKTLNSGGSEYGKYNFVNSMTDVTGFGLLGHLIEMCEGSGVSATIKFNKVPVLKGVGNYINQHIYPGGTTRNFKSYGFKVSDLSEEQKIILCDPQTSGGLLVAVDPEKRNEFLKISSRLGIQIKPFGIITAKKDKVIYVE